MQTLQPDKAFLQQGRYQIKKVLGTGSFGITYLATTRIRMQAAISGNLGRLVQDQEVEVLVCIKEFFMKELNNRGHDGSTVEGSSNTLYANYRKRFCKEAENLSHLEHPNIVKVLEVFDENDTSYYVMQFIEGETLDDYIRHQKKGYLEEQEAKKIVLSIANALQYMHSRRMLHLDLKPKNIMRGTDGKEYIIDFGLSKQYDENGEPESSTAIGLGTPGYAPTEQADSISDGTFPATLDIYALGATLYKMLMGKTPPSANEVLNSGIPPRPAYVSAATWNLVEKAMEPRRKDRIQCVSDFLTMLSGDALINSVISDDDETEVIDVIKSEPAPKPTPTPKSTPKRKPSWPYLTVIIGLVVCAGIFYWLSERGGDNLVNNPVITEVTKQSLTIPLGLCIYTGEVDSLGIPHGKGEAYFSDGRIYKGNFVHGVAEDANAHFQYENGDTYEGSFHINRFSQGRYTVKEDGSYFVGTFKDGDPYQGSWYEKSGEKIE